MIGIGILLHTQVTLETPHLVTVRRSIREDVLKRESTLLTLAVQTRNHSKFIATTNTLSSREEWMDLRISLEVGQTMFRALEGSVVSSGWVWRKIHCLTTRTTRTEMRIDMADFRGNKKYAYYNFFMVGNAASKYKLQVAGLQRYCRRQY